MNNLLPNVSVPAVLPATAPTLAFVSRRRTKACFGYVDFPIEDPTNPSTGEGGMFVKLVVVDDRDYDATPWTICCGASVSDFLTEVLVGDDQVATPRRADGPVDESPEAILASFDQHNKDHRDWMQRHFPAYGDDAVSVHEQYLSRNYLAAMLLGVTGWSGASADGGYWVCRQENLTEAGKALYAQVQALYPNCRLHLLTYLDT